MSQKQSSQSLFHRNYSASLTSRTLNSGRTLKEIKFQKKINKGLQSTKSLQTMRKGYEKISESKQSFKILNFIRSMGVQKHYQIQSQKYKNLTQNQGPMKQKMKKLINSLHTDLLIYKKIQESVKRQKTIVSKLHGWDQKIGEIFFDDESIKSAIDVQNVQKLLFSVKNARHDGQLRTLFNKMKLFQSELRQFNIKQQTLFVHIKSKHLEENISEFVQKIRDLESPQSKKQSIADYVRKFSPNKQKKSLKPIILTDRQIQGAINLNLFDLQRGQDFDQLQDVVYSGYKNYFSLNKK